MEKPRQNLLPLLKQKIKRSKQYRHKIQNRSRKHRKLLRRLLSNTLRRNLPENKNNNSSDRRRNTRPRIFPQKPHKQKSRQRSTGNIHNIIPNQNSRQQPVIILRQLQNQSRPLIPLIRHIFNPNPVQRRKSRLRRRKITRHNNTQQNNNQSNVHP